MLTVPIVIAILGGIALLIAIIGELHIVGKILIPKMSGRQRVLSFTTGGVFVAIAIWLAITPSPPQTAISTAAVVVITSIPSPIISTYTSMPTYTLAPTANITPTSAPPLPPLVEIFPQVGDGEEFIFTNFGGLLTNEFVTDQTCAHSGPYGLRLTYEMKGAGNGGWGVHWDNAPAKQFDASGYTAFIFWVRGTSGRETFQVGLKDTNGKEGKVEMKLIVVEISDWTMITIQLSKFKGVNTASIKNVDFGFNKNHGSGCICIDDLAFVVP